MADENMELDERKVKILDAVIRNYLATGEPVGSRTISKYTDLNLSSATIRNEMADLEELGYIVQPHTSAGRIPSDKGYRFYVDHLMQEKDREVKEMKDFVIEKTQKMDEVLKKVAKMLANNTNYATIVSAPTYSGNKVKFMQLSNVDEKHILAVIVMNSNMVKNQMIDVEEPLDNETLLKLNILLNTALNGLSLQEINLGTISKLKEQAGVHSEIVSHVLDALAAKGRTFRIRHCANSGALTRYPEMYLDMVRPGIALYGVGDDAERLGLRPVMRLKSCVSTIKVLDPDTTVSYGRTFRTEGKTRMGVLPIGYADGFFRGLSNRMAVQTAYGPAPQRGRICMDMCMVDLTDLPEVKVGDTVEIFGQTQSVGSLAAILNTIPYELTCAVSKRVPRLYMENGKEIERSLRLL